MTSSTLIHLCNHKSDGWESAVISFLPPVLYICAAVCRSATNRFGDQTNSTLPPPMADVFWGRRRSCLEMRCSSRRTKRRQGPQAWSCEVRWEEDDIIVLGQKLQRWWGGSHMAQSRSLSAFSVRTPACHFISKPTCDSLQHVRLPLFQSKMTHEVLMLIVSVFSQRFTFHTSPMSSHFYGVKSHWPRWQFEQMTPSV